MGRLLLLMLLFLGGTCPGQLPHSPPVLSSTLILPDLHVLSCSPLNPEQRVTQVHWKERHADGTYSLIGAHHPLWGNSTQPLYSGSVELGWNGNATYSLKIRGEDKWVCCEMIIYPIGGTQESCITLTEEADIQGIRTELLGTLLAGGAFTLGSIIILCYICRTKTWRVHTLREESQQTRRSSHICHNITTPICNLANCLPPMTILLHDEFATSIKPHHHRLPQRGQIPPSIPPPRNQLRPEVPPPRHQLRPEVPPPRHQLHPKVPPPRNQLLQEIPSPRNQLLPEIPPPRSQLYTEVPPPRNKQLLEVPPPRNQLLPEVPPPRKKRHSDNLSPKDPLHHMTQSARNLFPNDLWHTAAPSDDLIYTNIHIQRCQHNKTLHLPVTPGSKLHQEAPSQRSFTLDTQTVWDMPLPCSPNDNISLPPSWFPEIPSISQHEVTSLYPLGVPPSRTPDSTVFTTINPMYHTSAQWASQPKHTSGN
ncbi:uncharacterized protein O3C94_008088 [Discoglossus pictus]